MEESQSEIEKKRAQEAKFVTLLTECQHALQLYVRSLLPGERSAAIDIAQQASAKIWEKRETFEPGTNFRAWAFAIARFEVLNYRKQQVRDNRLRFSDELESTFATELAAVQDDSAVQHEALKYCLKQLRPAGRELLMLRYATQVTTEELSVQVGRTPQSLRVSLHRLRSTLADCIRRKMSLIGETS